MKKKKILVYWPYRRKDLLLPFEKLSDHFEWCFLYFAFEAEDKDPFPFERVYWREFTSPFALLNKVRPDKVLFFELSNLNTVGLNYACKNRHIPTSILDHGIKVSYDYYIDLDKNGVSEAVSSNAPAHTKTTASNPWKTLRFYFSGLRPRNLFQIPQAAYFLFRVYKTKSEAVFPEVKFNFRKPDTYLLFSRQNFPYFHHRDGMTSSEAVYFGNPFFDDMIREMALPANRKSYYLLLDDGAIETFGVTLEQKNAFFRQLNEASLAHGVRLRIKLHPYDYNRPGFYQHKNVEYLQGADIAALVKEATGVFGISSTLILPLIPLGKIILFRIRNCPIQDHLEEAGVQFVDFYQFHPNEIDFTRRMLPENRELEFIDRFLYRNDGKALERLKEILEQ